MAVTTQMSPLAGRAGLGGHKRSASSTASGSVHQGHNPNKLASASDFSPGNFDEPSSDGHISPVDLRQQNSIQALPMRIDPVISAYTGHSNMSMTPISNPLSQNLLLH